MDNTPDYLSVLDHVAQQHGGTTSMTFLGTLLKSQWERFETLARSEKWDIFISVHNDYLGMRRAVGELCSSLYHVQGADWHHDVATIRAKDAEYGGSWHKRGGGGAFFMLARKWDRIANQLEKVNGDLKEALAKDQREEGILDDINDLRCYLLLVLSWYQAQDNPKLSAPQEELAF